VNERDVVPAGFDPGFDDTEWTDGWLDVPISEVPPGVYADGSRVERRDVDRAEVFGRSYRLAVPLDCRVLYDSHGRLWMSTTPQERIMMYNNGRRSRGHVLVGGLGLGLYPQYAVLGAAGSATRFTVIERSPAVRDIVEPTLRAVLSAPLDTRIGEIGRVLAGPAITRYDTVFLDTWDTLDAARLPFINALRNQAVRHLAPGGRVLLWGYRWMVRLFEDACRHLLAVRSGERQAWLTAPSRASAQAIETLMPVVEHFAGAEIADIDAALAWCRRYIVRAVSK
jgi:hypothetical protein